MTDPKISKTGYTIADDGLSITCHRCEMTSHNMSDVRNAYCGKCHAFHDPSGERKLIGCAVTILRPGAADRTIVNVRLTAKPSLRELHAFLDPYFVREGETKARYFEHVSVLFNDKLADMFVDETGVNDGLPRNDAATAIYRAAFLRNHPEAEPESLPHIAGIAVIPWRKLWH